MTSSIAGRKLSAAESRRVTDKAVELYRAGYTCSQIGRAMGLYKTVIIRRLRAIGVEIVPGNARRTVAPQFDPPPFTWQDEANGFGTTLSTAMLDTPEWRRSTTVALWQSVLITSQHDNAVNRFANDVADALAATDADWLHDTAHLLANVRVYLDRLELVLVDDEARHRAITDPAERDDLAGLSLNGAR